MVMQVFSYNVGKNLKRFRKSKGMSQAQFADIVGVNQSQYSKMERGTQSVSCCVLCMLEQRYNISPAFFFMTQNDTTAFKRFESYLHKNSSEKEA